MAKSNISFKDKRKTTSESLNTNYILKNTFFNELQDYKVSSFLDYNENVLNANRKTYFKISIFSEIKFNDAIKDKINNIINGITDEYQDIIIT